MLERRCRARWRSTTVLKRITDTAAFAGPNLAHPALITAPTANPVSAITWLRLLQCRPLRRLAPRRAHHPVHTSRQVRIPALADEPDAREEIVKIAGWRRMTPLWASSMRCDTQGLHHRLLLRPHLARHHPDLLPLGMISDDHATGDGLQLALALSAPVALCDLAQVQGPSSTPRIPAPRLARSSLHGAGGLLLDAHRARFVREVERRDVVTEAMRRVEGAVRLVLWERAVEEVKKDRCRRTMKGTPMRRRLLRTVGSRSTIFVFIPYHDLHSYNIVHSRYTGIHIDDLLCSVNHQSHTPTAPLCAAIITPVFYYTMGSLAVDASVRAMSSSSIIHLPPTPRVCTRDSSPVGRRRTHPRRAESARVHGVVVAGGGGVWTGCGGGGVVSGSGVREFEGAREREVRAEHAANDLRIQDGGFAEIEEMEVGAM
ncbi:hypothetical protein C8R45DRAFT_942292 [Mycena sanguinolenta]|nr:hypothetical protein C8R45DRAFT_942292 [Mycena sanguinolenta]